MNTRFLVRSYINYLTTWYAPATPLALSSQSIWQIVSLPIFMDTDSPIQRSFFPIFNQSKQFDALKVFSNCMSLGPPLEFTKLLFSKKWCSIFATALWFFPIKNHVLSRNSLFFHCLHKGVSSVTQKSVAYKLIADIPWNWIHKLVKDKPLEMCHDHFPVVLHIKESRNFSTDVLL